MQEAQQRLEEMHREKVTRVMKDWSDLEEKYQDMRLADPKAAQGFKQRMTARFQVCSNIYLCASSLVPHHCKFIMRMCTHKHTHTFFACAKATNRRVDYTIRETFRL